MSLTQRLEKSNYRSKEEDEVTLFLNSNTPVLETEKWYDGHLDDGQTAGFRTTKARTEGGLCGVLTNDAGDLIDGGFFIGNLDHTGLQIELTVDPIMAVSCCC